MAQLYGAHGRSVRVPHIIYRVMAALRTAYTSLPDVNGIDALAARRIQAETFGANRTLAAHPVVMAVAVPAATPPTPAPAAAPPATSSV